MWIDKDLDTAVTRLCFYDPVPARVVARQSAAHYFAGVVDDVSSRPLVREDGMWKMRRGQRCLRYKANLAGAAALTMRPDLAVRMGDTVVITPDLLLLRPERLSLQAEMTLTVSTWGDRAVSAPYELDDRGRFRFGANALWWRSAIAIGDLGKETLTAGGAHIEVVFADAPSFTDRDRYLRWVRTSADAAAGLTGRLPVERLQVLIVPAPFPGEDAVMFGMVTRGGHPGALLVVRDSADPVGLDDDWVAVHELSHLALPFIEREDRWMSEGFATWAQQVLRVRAGLIDEADGWTGFLRGLERARDADVRRVPHVYWAGAGWWLLADLHLRARGTSLDEALSPIAGCCFGQPRAATADAVLARIAATSPAFAEWLERAPALDDAPARAFALLGEMGVRATDGGVVLDDDAPRAAARRASVAGEGEPTDL